MDGDVPGASHEASVIVREPVLELCATGPVVTVAVATVLLAVLLAAPPEPVSVASTVQAAGTIA